MNLKDYFRNQDPVILTLQIVFIPAAFFAVYVYIIAFW